MDMHILNEEGRRKFQKAAHRAISDRHRGDPSRSRAVHTAAASRQSNPPIASAHLLRRRSCRAVTRRISFAGTPDRRRLLLTAVLAAGGGSHAHSSFYY